MFAIREVCEIATSLPPILDESLMTRGCNIIIRYGINMVGPETMCLYASNSSLLRMGLRPRVCYPGCMPLYVVSIELTRVVRSASPCQQTATPPV